ncbi:MAG: exopolysaccharide Pel transporter PelG [Ruminococcus sp.]|nr:exopolysaccharide Pel transporter PelG [Ruminococcus sp.]
MAGIGFELNKMLEKKSVLTFAGYYAASAVIYVGPTILGIVLLAAVRILCEINGTSKADQDMIIVIISYSLIAAIAINNLFNLVVTRYIADCIYNHKHRDVLPAMYGGILLQLGFGTLLYGVFVVLSGIDLVTGILTFMMFSLFLTAWTMIAFLSAVKDYKRIMLYFVLGILVAIAAGYLLMLTTMNPVHALLIMVIIGYGFMITAYHIVLTRYFNVRSNRFFAFTHYIRKYPALVVIGICVTVGMYFHMVWMWYGPYGVIVGGQLYRSLPIYDIPALFAFVTTFFATINFSAQVEVNFYPFYRNYFDLLNGEGTIRQIDSAETSLTSTMWRELSYLTIKQLIFSVLVIALGAQLLDALEIVYFDSVSEGVFQTLCIGYGLYAVGNSIMLVLLYFSDYKDAAISTFVFAAGTIIGSIIFDDNFAVIGLGFTIGAALFYITSILLLYRYTSKLRFKVLTKAENV